MIVSIDIETTGLNAEHCQILEFGAVIDDFQNPKPLSALPQFHCYVVHPIIIGEAAALALNAEIIRRIARREAPYKYAAPGDVHGLFHNFLVANKCQNNNEWTVKITVAGKNFAIFDKKFIDKIWPTNPNVIFHHRIVDPAMLYFDPKIDKIPPSLAQCLERAGMAKSVAHTAVEDALDVLAVTRKHYNICQ